MKSNYDIISKAAISTGNVTSGLLNPGQAKQFLQMTFEATPLGGLVRNVIRPEKIGEIDKIGIASRMLRKKVENTDDGFRAVPTFGKIEYTTTAVRLPWEITEEALRENIEGENFEDVVVSLMTKQVAVDKEDLCLNGDEAITESDDDYDFLKINNGWVKQIAAGGHVLDRADENDGKMSVDVFYDALKQMPNKYNNGNLRWLMSPRRKQDWDKYLLDRVIAAGGGITDAIMNSPASVPVVAVPALADDKIILTDPQNLVAVHSYSVKIRKSTEGEKAIMQDKRFYVIHFDFDPVIEEPDAVVMVKELAAL
ncbi:MAG: phage major capsid protein [Oscillospiraceae bacterium]|nr:phage major capsid protein [Oscillospiraceae bacterium]